MNQESRPAHPRAARQIVAPLIVLGALLTLLLLPGLNPTCRWQQALLDFGHLPAFMCITLALRQLFGRSPSGIAKAVGLAVLVALGTEWLQTVTGRDSSWDDLERNLFGITAIVALILSKDSRPTARGFLILLSTVVILASTRTLTGTVMAYVERNDRFPELLLLDGRYRLNFVVIDNAELSASGQLRLFPGNYSNLELTEPVADWSGYKRLVLECTNPNQTTRTLYVRVHDRSHNGEFDDRWNAAFSLPPGDQRQTFDLSDVTRGPKTRILNLKAVSGLVLFGANLTDTITVAIRSIRLE